MSSTKPATKPKAKPTKGLKSKATDGPTVRLDPARIAAWRARRHFLREPARARAFEAVAEQLVGIQAQVASAAEQSLCTRVAKATPNDVRKALDERRLVRTWAMRGTLHLVPVDLFPTLTAALSTRTHWRKGVWLRNFRVTLAELDRLIEAIATVLDDGRPRTRAELADEVAGDVGETLGARLRSSWGEFLKPAAYQGLLCQGPQNGSQITFVRPERWLKRWQREDPEEALPRIIAAYLATYGPATIDDVARWWGVPPADIRARLKALVGGGSVVEVDVDGRTALLRAEDVDAVAASRPLRSHLRLLGPFDPLIVGAGLRGSFIPRDQEPRVSRTAGWISPVLLVNGRVGGLWQSDAKKGRIVVRVEAFEPLEAAGRSRLEREVVRVGKLLAPEADAALELGKVDFAARAPQPFGARNRTTAATDVS